MEIYRCGDIRFRFSNSEIKRKLYNVYLCVLWRIALPANYQERDPHSEEQHTSPRRSVFNHGTRNKEEKSLASIQLQVNW